MTYSCELIQQPAQPVLSIRTRTAVGNLPQVISTAFGSIMQYLHEIGENMAGAPFAAYYNMDMQDLDVEHPLPVGIRLKGRTSGLRRTVPSPPQKHRRLQPGRCLPAATSLPAPAEPAAVAPRPGSLSPQAVDASDTDPYRFTISFCPPNHPRT